MSICSGDVVVFLSSELNGTVIGRLYLSSASEKGRDRVVLVNRRLYSILNFFRAITRMFQANMAVYCGEVLRCRVCALLCV